jgi:hypothetical protein
MVAFPIVQVLIVDAVLIVNLPRLIFRVRGGLKMDVAETLCTTMHGRASKRRKRMQHGTEVGWTSAQHVWESSRRCAAISRIFVGDSRRTRCGGSGAGGCGERRASKGGGRDPERSGGQDKGIGAINDRSADNHLGKDSSKKIVNRAKHSLTLRKSKRKGGATNA